MIRFLISTLQADSAVLSKDFFNAMTPRPEAFVRIRHGLGYWAGNDRGYHLAGASGDNGSVHNVLMAFPDQHIGYFTLVSGGDNAIPVIRSAHA